jgi:anti-anti-sigma regulatory factor
VADEPEAAGLSAMPRQPGKQELRVDFSTRPIEPVLVIRVRGRFAIGEEFASAFAAEVASAETQGFHRIIVDLDIDHFNSIAIGSLFREEHRLRHSGGRLAFFSVRTSVHNFFSIIKGHPLLHHSEREALCAVLYPPETEPRGVPVPR